MKTGLLEYEEERTIDVNQTLDRIMSIVLDIASLHVEKCGRTIISPKDIYLSLHVLALNEELLDSIEIPNTIPAPEFSSPENNKIDNNEQYDDDEIYLDQIETQIEEFSFASEIDQSKHPYLYQIWFYDTFKNQFKIDLDDAYEMGSKKNNQLRTIIEKSILQLQIKFEI